MTSKLRAKNIVTPSATMNIGTVLVSVYFDLSIVAPLVAPFLTADVEEPNSCVCPRGNPATDPRFRIYVKRLFPGNNLLIAAMSDKYQAEWALFSNHAILPGRVRLSANGIIPTLCGYLLGKYCTGAGEGNATKDCN
jgi:hypothetical protein